MCIRVGLGVYAYMRMHVFVRVHVCIHIVFGIVFIFEFLICVCPKKFLCFRISQLCSKF